MRTRGLAVCHSEPREDWTWLPASARWGFTQRPSRQSRPDPAGLGPRLQAIAMQIKKSPLSAQLRLSERRARAAADWLVKNAGFKADLISTKGFDEAVPVMPNTGAAIARRAAGS